MRPSKSGRASQAGPVRQVGQADKQATRLHCRSDVRVTTVKEKRVGWLDSQAHYSQHYFRAIRPLTLRSVTGTPNSGSNGTDAVSVYPEVVFYENLCDSISTLWMYTIRVTLVTYVK